MAEDSQAPARPLLSAVESMARDFTNRENKKASKGSANGGSFEFEFQGFRGSRASGLSDKMAGLKA